MELNNTVISLKQANEGLDSNLSGSNAQNVQVEDQSVNYEIVGSALGW